MYMYNKNQNSREKKTAKLSETILKKIKIRKKNKNNQRKKKEKHEENSSENK